jgi:hypothetical protein
MVSLSRHSEFVIAADSIRGIKVKQECVALLQLDKRCVNIRALDSDRANFEGGVSRGDAVRFSPASYAGSGTFLMLMSLPIHIDGSDARVVQEQ